MSAGLATVVRLFALPDGNRRDENPSNTLDPCYAEGALASIADDANNALLVAEFDGLHKLIERSLAAVRLNAAIQNVERVAVWELMDEVEIGAAMLAQQIGVHFSVASVDRMVVVRADRQILPTPIRARGSKPGRDPKDAGAAGSSA